MVPETLLQPEIRSRHRIRSPPLPPHPSRPDFQSPLPILEGTLTVCGRLFLLALIQASTALSQIITQPVPTAALRSRPAQPPRTLGASQTDLQLQSRERGCGPWDEMLRTSTSLIL